MKLVLSRGVDLHIVVIFQIGGGGRTRTYEGVSQRIYRPPPLPLGTLPRNEAAGAPAGGPGRGRYMVGRPRLVNRKWAELPRLGPHDKKPACANASGHQSRVHRAVTGPRPVTHGAISGAIRAVRVGTRQLSSMAGTALRRR